MVNCRISLSFLSFAISIVLLPSLANAQPAAANYDEAKVPSYTLPDPLTLLDGAKVSDAETWRKVRRPEILGLFETYMFGRSPGRPAGMTFEVTSNVPGALDGKATRKEVTVYFTGKKDGPKMAILIYLPAKAEKPSPLFVGLNFQRESRDFDRSGHYALDAMDVGRCQRGRRRSSRDREVARRGSQPLAGRDDSRARLRRGDDLLRRHRPRLRRRLPERRPPVVLQAGADAARPGRVGLHRRLGMGPEPGDGLLRDRPVRSTTGTWPCSAIRGSARRRSGQAPRTSGSRW